MDTINRSWQMRPVKLLALNEYILENGFGLLVRWEDNKKCIRQIHSSIENFQKIINHLLGSSCGALESKGFHMK